MGFYKEIGDRLEKWLKEKIKVVDTKVESIAKYQKYVNTELDYCVMYGDSSEKIDIADNTPITQYLNIFEGNMEIDDNGYIKLSKGKIYKVIAKGFTLANGTAIIIFDSNGKSYSPLGYVTGTNDYTDLSSEVIIEADDSDIFISYKTDYKLTTQLNFCSIMVQEINRQITIDPLEHVNESQGVEDTPVGHIISHMGTVAPKHYLICDGSEYNIADYPYLAQHMIDNFGTVNYFGGDGTTTFAVPDLRGEFLRGTGTATRDTGSGGEVGEHQDPTRIPTYEGGTVSGANGGQITDYDKMITSGHNWFYHNSSTNNGGGYYSSHVTLRPTNTSVLYCIKYEPTYFMNTYNTNYIQPSLYSLEEKVVGSWIDGKPLYEKVVKVTMPNKTIGTSTPHGIENLDTLTNFSLNWYDSEDKAWYDRFRMWISSSTNYSISNELNIDSKNINITPNGNNIIDWSSRTTNAFCKLQYTKTTDEENSFTNDMVKDYIVRDDAQIVEMRKEIDELKAIVETLQTSTLSI